MISRAADAVLVERRREASLGAVVATVQLEANAYCGNAILGFTGVEKAKVEIVK